MIRNCFSFGLPCSVIGLENCAISWTNQIQKLNQSQVDHSKFPALQAGSLVVFFFEFSLARRDIFLGSDWLRVLWFGYTTQNKKCSIVM